MYVAARRKKSPNPNHRGRHVPKKSILTPSHTLADAKNTSQLLRPTQIDKELEISRGTIYKIKQLITLESPTVVTNLDT